MSLAMECYIDAARTPAQRRLNACVERWMAARDRRALFASGWAMALDSVMATARAGRFHESAWILQLVEQWAEYYFITVEPDEDDLRLVTPPAWAHAHAAAVSAHAAPTDVLLLGVNAHAGNDLPQAMRDVLATDWPMSVGRLEQRRRDVQRMLGVVGDTLDGVQGLLERFDSRLGGSHPMGRPVRAPATGARTLLDAWAPQLWADALALVTAADRRWAAAIREAIECTAARRSHLMLCDIDARTELLTASPRTLDRRFPHRHDSQRCHLGAPSPVWGELAASGSV